tara:strand:- start:19 stop:462 length:444 start_codon:yes stop_codon:yes gene_type:complete
MINWTYLGKEITDVSQIGSPFGFCYKITNISNGMIYYGSKQVVSIRKKKFGKRKISQMPDKRKSKYEKIIKEMPGWREYTSSSKSLNFDIHEKHHEYTKEILYLCSSKSELKYKEAEYIMCEQALLRDNCYNANISIKQVGKPNFNK